MVDSPSKVALSAQCLSVRENNFVQVLFEVLKLFEPTSRSEKCSFSGQKWAKPELSFLESRPVLSINRRGWLTVPQKLLYLLCTEAL